MAATYWHKQNLTSPLFPELDWDKPERLDQAGRLLIIGGNAHGFAAPAQSYEIAKEAGIGNALVLLPSALQKTIGKVFANADFAPSTPSGSFARTSLGEWLHHASWANSVLLTGDIGRNSETGIVIESFCSKYSGKLAITKESADYVPQFAKSICRRPDTLLVLSLGQLQKLVVALNLPKTITTATDLPKVIDFLHELTSDFAISIITKHGQILIAAHAGEVSTTQTSHQQNLWQAAAAARAVTCWTHHPTKPFEAFTHSLSSPK